MTQPRLGTCLPRIYDFKHNEDHKEISAVGSTLSTETLGGLQALPSYSPEDIPKALHHHAHAAQGSEGNSLPGTQTWRKPCTQLSFCKSQVPAAFWKRPETLPPPVLSIKDELRSCSVLTRVALCKLWLPWHHETCGIPTEEKSL